MPLPPPLRNSGFSGSSSPVRWRIHAYNGGHTHLDHGLFFFQCSRSTWNKAKESLMVLATTKAVFPAVVGDN